MAFFCSILTLLSQVLYVLAHNNVQYCKRDNINEQHNVFMMYMGRKCFSLLRIPTFRAIFFDK